MIPTWLSLVALQIVMMTTCGAASDSKVVVTIKFQSLNFYLKSVLQKD